MAIETTHIAHMAKRLLNEKEAAHYLGRSVWGIREMRYAGKLPFVKDGRRVLFDIRDLDTWIDRTKMQYRY